MIEGFAEDFRPGQLLRHGRGRTITDHDLSVLTLLVMNTAQGHFNEHAMRDTPFGERINFGGLTLSLVVGLASADTAGQALAEIGLDTVRFPTPVRAGDTVYAATEVLGVDPTERTDAAVLRLRHWGLNQDGQTVCVADRSVLVRRRPPGAGAA